MDCCKIIQPKIKNFCREHHALEDIARRQLQKRKDRFDDHRRGALRGNNRHHVREDSDVEIENEENDADQQQIQQQIQQQDEEEKKEEIPDSWKFKVGRCWLYGYYAIVKPCGYFMWMEPLYRSEGCARVMEIWNDCYEGKGKPAYTWTDSGCNLWRYVNNRPVLRGIWQFTRWLVDRFHGNKSHNMNNPDVENFCSRNCDVSKMNVADKPPGIHQCSNSQAQEQIMKSLGSFTWMQNMHYDLMWFNLFWITMDINTDLLIEKTKSGENIEPELCLYE